SPADACEPEEVSFLGLERHKPPAGEAVVDECLAIAAAVDDRRSRLPDEQVGVTVAVDIARSTDAPAEPPLCCRSGDGTQQCAISVGVDIRQSGTRAAGAVSISADEQVCRDIAVDTARNCHAVAEEVGLHFA